MKTYQLKKTTGESLETIYENIDKGGKFIIYGYCISFFVMSLRLVSSPFFIKPNEKISKYRNSYTIRSLIFGWWGLPWGPIYTIQTIRANYRKGGGIDVTDHILTKIQEKYAQHSIKSIFEENLIIEYQDHELMR